MHIMLQIVNVLLENCVNVCRHEEKAAITITNTVGISFVTLRAVHYSALCSIILIFIHQKVW